MKRRRTLERILPRSPETRAMVLVGAGLFVVSAVVSLIVIFAAPRSRPGGMDPEGGNPAAIVPGTRSEVGLGDLILPQTAPFAQTPRSAGGRPQTAPFAQTPRSAGGPPQMPKMPPTARQNHPAGQDPSAGQEPMAGDSPPYLFREPLSRWGDAQVQRYWVPLKQIAADLIRQENDRRIDEMFEEVH